MVGGVGIALLFGVLPAVIFFIKHKSFLSRVLALAIGLLFTAALLVDLSNDFGLIETDAILVNLQKEAVTQQRQ